MTHLILAAECVKCTWQQEYWGLMSDLPHWLFELTIMAVVDGLIGLLLWPMIKRSHARLGKKVHEELDTEHGVVHGEESLTLKALTLSCLSGVPLNKCYNDLYNDELNNRLKKEANGPLS